MDVAFRLRTTRPETRAKDANRPLLYLESDFYMDVDDVGALAIAMNLHTAGVIDLAGFGVNADNEWGARCAAILRYVYDLDFPIGIRSGIAEESGRRDYAHSRTVCNSYPHVPDESAEDGTVALRRVLGTADDGTITVVSVGFMHNLVGLLDSGPDTHSDLTGVELIQRKVARTVVMGGVYPTGREHNLSWRPAETLAFLTHWPTTIDFVGFEAADQAITARGLSADLGPANPVALAYGIFESYAGVAGRPSWDPLTVYLAAHPHTDLVGWSDPGHVILEDDGTNDWQDDATGPHRYAIPRVSQDKLAAELDGILRQPPLVSPERANAVRSMTSTWTTLPYQPTDPSDDR